MQLRPPLRRTPQRPRPQARHLATAFAGLALAAWGGHALAEGSRSLYPEGYFLGETGHDSANGNAGRAPMNLAANVYGSKVRARTFLYVYLEAGETLALGRSSTGDITVYSPDTNFGPKGNENPSGGTSQTLSVSGSTGLIDTRAKEIAGPLPAPGGYTPLTFTAATTGIHGILFSGSSEIPMWDATVLDGGSVVDGRLFTYAYAGRTGDNNNAPAGEVDPDNRKRLYSTQYYVTADGYRYKQELKGLDPNAFVLYANSLGFLDGVNPLYKDVVGNDNYLANLQGAADGIALQSPEYPLFFSDAMSAPGINDTLTALGIPLSPPLPQISDVGFIYPAANTAHTYVGLGGTIYFTATDVTTYEIILSADGIDYDKTNLANRVLTGVAQPGRNEVIWDGRAANGLPFAEKTTGGYEFQIVGRNGEAHFPFLDAEKNFNGGPIVTKLNPHADLVTWNSPTRVHYDDRAYRTRNGNTTVGYIAPDGTLGHLCGGDLLNLGTLVSPHITTPYQAVDGVDSDYADPAYGTASDGTPRYARYWGGTGANTTGCGTRTEFADKMGLDLWVLEQAAPVGPLSGFLIFDSTDVTTRVTAPSSAAPGATVVAQIEFGNVGSRTATGVTYQATLPAGLGGVTCAAATCTYDPASGALAISGLPGSLSPGQWLPAVTVSYPGPASGTATLTSTITTVDPQAPTPGHATDTASAGTTVGGAATTADVSAEISPPATAVVGQPVFVPVTFRNFGPLDAADVSYQLQLPPGTAGISCSAPALCAPIAPDGTVAVTLPGTLAAGTSQSFVLTYQAPGEPGSVPSRATIATTTAETSATNNVANGMTYVMAAAGATADVTVSISPPATADAGSTVTVPVVFENKGPAAATDVSYSVTVPAGISVNCTPGCTQIGTTVTWPSSTLGNGEKLTPSFTYTAPTSGPVTVAASVGTSTTESNAANNSASAATAITSPDLVTTIGAIPPAAPGQTVNVPVTVTNQGDGTATGVTYQVTLPPGLTGVTCSGGATCSYDPATGIVTVTGLPGTLAPGASTSYTVQYTAPASGVSVSARADTANDTNPANNEASRSASAHIAAVPALGPVGLLSLLAGVGLLGGLRRRKQGIR